MSHRRSPCFFKILLDPSALHLPLPPEFVLTHLDNKIPKNPIIRSATGGYSWRLKIQKIGESYCFSNGWESVVRDIKLGFGDFLVFRFDDKSIFKMLVFSPSGCEKDFPPKTHMDISSNNNNSNSNNNNNNNNSESGIVDDDDDVIEDVGDDDEDEDEIEDDDEEEEEEEGYEEEKDDGDDDGNGDGDEDGGGDIDGDDGDPFFEMVISKSHKFLMRLPAEFAELAGIDGERTLTVANDDGKEWKIGLRAEKLAHSERYFLSVGWQDFRRSNDLSEGDECWFKFIRSEDKLLLAKVTKYKRPPARQSAGAKAPPSEVVKRTREQPKRDSGKILASKVEKPPAREGGGGEDVVKKPRGRPAREEGGGADVVKRPRGRPRKRIRGLPARQK